MTASTVPNFSLRDIGISSISPATAQESLSSQYPARSSFRVSAPIDKSCLSATGNGQDDRPVLCEDIVSAYTTMRGPRPVNQHDPLLSLLARSKAQTSGTSSASSSASASAASTVSGPCFSVGKQSSPYVFVLLLNPGSPPIFC